MRRLGGDRTLASPGKSRVRCRYATSLLSVGREGLEPSSRRLKAAGPTIERASRGAMTFGCFDFCLENLGVRIGCTPPVLRRSLPRSSVRSSLFAHTDIVLAPKTTTNDQT